MATEASSETGVEEFAAAGLAWRAESADAEAVRRAVAERLASLETAPGVEVLKRNLVRTVLRLPLPDGRRVIVKRYRVGGVLDVLKYLVRPSRARTEWEIGRALARAGIATSVPLAFGERRVAGALRDAALVTREIGDSLHLNAYVERHLAADAARRGRLYDELGRLVRRFHDAGFVHHDFHGGNLLVNGPPDGPALHVIDLHSVTRTARPGDGARWADLVKLLHSMLTCSTEEERVRLCEAYEREGGPSGTRLAGLLAHRRLPAAIEPELAAMELRRVRSRTERSLERSSKFDVASAGGFRVHHLRSVAPSDVLAAISAHRRDVAARAANVLKDGRRSALTRQRIGGRVVVVKEYRGDTWWERAKNAVRSPRAVAAWLAGNGLGVRGFDAAEPLALVLRGRGSSLREAYLVMEDLGDGTRADLVVLSRYAGDLGREAAAEKRALVRSAALLVRRLHGADVYHGDLKAVNVFLRGAPGGGRLVLADYDRVEFDRPVTPRRRVKNLAQLSASVPVCVSLTDRLRFFRAYAEGDDAALGGWKHWFRRVVEECRRKIVVRMEPIE